MTRQLIVFAAFTLAFGCRGSTSPESLPEGAPDYRGRIVFLENDGRYRVDDGSPDACGLAWMRVSDSTEIRWFGGGQARAEHLQVGRRVSFWVFVDDPYGARCRTADARLVVIEDTRLWWEL